MAIYPRITADLTKIKHNIDTLCALCSENGVSIAAVAKVVCADERIVRVLENSAATMLGDARTENLARLITNKPKLLLRAPAPEEADETVELADISLVSEIATIRALGKAARAAKRTHQIILMIDLGDLREGLLFLNREAIECAADAAKAEEGVELIGVGTNLTCYGAIIPDETNLGELCRIADELRARTGLPIPIVSGGNSSSLGLLKRGMVPEGVNHLRLGESILLGNDTAARRVMNGLYGDAFTLSTRLIEVQRKPSVPIGESGANAFGEHPSFESAGEQIRGICKIGRQDTVADGLSPRDGDIKIIGASSDHLIVDLTNAKAYEVGDVLAFTPDYGALLRAYTSAYVYRDYIE
ncbi:MAG: alanine/ornithine racemase family PLP-dependent enzyme [Eubacteriales bacterium]|jgi:predicted amino acid racemase|nr:alanine/ornithine racemase family PLP-dependent enzyme [Eubacteriales bacterium]